MANSYPLAGSRPGGFSVVTTETTTGKVYVVAGIGAVEEGTTPTPPASPGQPPLVIVIT